MRIVALQHQAGLMAGSMKSVQSIGLDPMESLGFGDDENKIGNAWDNAW